MSDRLKEYAAQAAIGTGIGLVGGIGEKIVSNLFRKGGAAEMAMTPQQTLDQRMQAAAAQNQMNQAKIANQRAQAQRRIAQAQQIPFDIDLKRAQAGKARMETQLAPVKEGRQRDRLDFDKQEADLDRLHDKDMAFLNSKLDLILEGEKQKGRKELAKFTNRLKRSGKQIKSYVLPSGEAITSKEMQRRFNAVKNQYDAAVKGGDQETVQMAGNQLNEFTSVFTDSLPIPFVAKPEDKPLLTSEDSRILAMDLESVYATGAGEAERKAVDERRQGIVEKVAQGQQPPSKIPLTKDQALNKFRIKLGAAGVTDPNSQQFQNIQQQIFEETGYKFKVK
jgi:hypothetical protein